MFRKSVIAVLLALTVVEPCGALSMSDVFNGALTNNTSGGAYHAQGANYYSGGSLYMRFPAKTYQLMSVSPPFIRAGCGGIDIYKGAFSFINQQQFTDMLRNIGQAATGYAFKLAIQNMCPSCDNIMSNLQRLANDANSMNINTCQAAEGIVNAITPTKEAGREDTQGTENFGVDTSAYKDASDAVSGLQTDFASFGQLSHVKKDQADKTGQDPGTEYGNVVWNALIKMPGLSINDAQIYMSLVGTFILPQPAASEAPTTVAGGSSSSVPAAQSQYLPPLSIPISGLIGLSGDTTIQVPVYSCGSDTQYCLTPSATDASGNPNKMTGTPFKAMVLARMDSIISAIQSGQGNYANQDQDIAFINNTSLPVYKALSVMTAIHDPQIVKTFEENYADIIAVDYAATFLRSVLYEVKQAMATKKASKSNAREMVVRDINDSIQHQETEIYDQTKDLSVKSQNKIQMAQEIVGLEGALESSMPPVLRQSLQWQRKG